MAEDHDFDVAVIGGGMAGLMASRQLLKSGFQRVVMLEADQRVGGRVLSHQKGGYWVNLGAQFLAGEGPLFAVADELGVEHLSLASFHPGLARGRKIIRSDEFLRLPIAFPGSLSDRLSVASLGLKIIRNYWQIALTRNRAAARQRRGTLEQMTAADLFAAAKPGSAGEQLMRCLVRFWLGAEPEEVAAAHAAVYLGLSLVNLRRLPPFAMPIGGTEQLIRVLHASLPATIVTGARVSAVRQDPNRVEVTYRHEHAERTLSARACVVATPAYVTREIVEDLPAAASAALGAVRYGTYLNVGVFTSEQEASPWDDYYTITPLDRPFHVLVNSVAALRGTEGERRGGALLAYAGGEPARAMMELSGPEVSHIFTSELCDLFPSLRGKIDQTIVQRWPAAVPYWGPEGRLGHRALNEPFGRVCLAGDYIGYPSMQIAASSGVLAARAIHDHLETADSNGESGQGEQGSAARRR